MRKSLVLALVLYTAAALAIDTKGMDPSVAPGNDFFLFANGAWFKATPIPPERASIGTGSIVAEQADRRTAELIRNAKGSKVGDYYAAFMDEKTIESRGPNPLKPELRAIAAINDRSALAAKLGSDLRADVDALNATDFQTDRVFGLWVSPDFANPSINVPYLLQGGLGMPDRENYISTDANDVELQKKYREHIASVLQLTGIDDAANRAARIYDLERKIAEAHATRTESVDVQKGNNPWTLAEFAAKAPGLDWPAYFTAAQLASQPKIIVWHPRAVTGIALLAGSEPLDTWRDYLTFHAIDRMSNYLPKAFAGERFRFYGTALSGTTQQRDRWKRAVDETNLALGDEVGKLYVTKYFPGSSKARVQSMVKNMIAAFSTRIDALPWMTPATKAKAKAKLSTLYVGIGYPERWRDYSGLDVRSDDAFGNAERAALFDYRRALAKLGKPVDKSEWWMTPQTVDALNLPLQNALNFPAAILQPPYFDPKSDAAENYGAIGSVIGHEISHSFDDQGSQFDELGRLANWWTAEDFAHFSEAASRLEAQYNAYEPLPGIHVNGKLTLSENIADVAGLSAAYDGYRASLGGKEGPTKQGYRGDQRFFIAFAQAWRRKTRPEALRSQIITNGHAPAEYRADTARNLDAWYSAFNVKPGQKLYLRPAERVRVW
ncbi:MAG: peptidase M13 [Acidobacteria bacterium]|nr:MAG: peptidase M13 [Acidobacteriota bacterium]